MVQGGRGKEEEERRKKHGANKDPNPAASHASEDTLPGGAALPSVRQKMEQLGISPQECPDDEDEIRMIVDMVLARM